VGFPIPKPAAFEPPGLVLASQRIVGQLETIPRLNDVGFPIRWLARTDPTSEGRGFSDPLAG